VPDKVKSRWTILSEPYKRENRKTSKLYVQARCLCGTYKEVIHANILKGISKSCGCLQKEAASITGGYNKLSEGEQARNSKFGAYKNNAKIRDYSWELTIEEFSDIVIKDCVYCGSSLGCVEKSKNDNGDFHYTGIDRVNNSIGYVIGNCVPCCITCNLAKGTKTKEEFIEMCKKVTEHQKVFDKHK
jgi:hypothetical protein